MSRKRKLMIIAPLAILGIAAFIAIGGTVVMALWNRLLPPLFDLPRLSFWQALGMLALCRILFGGFGGRGSSSHVRRRMAERWETMTPEERERFRQGMHRRWGSEPRAGETSTPGPSGE